MLRQKIEKDLKQAQEKPLAEKRFRPRLNEARRKQLFVGRARPAEEEGVGAECCGPGVTNKAPLFTRDTRLLVFTWRPGDGADSWDPGTRACEAALSLKQQRPDKQNLCLYLSLASKQTFLFGPTSVFRTTASPRLPVFSSSLMRFWKA